MPTWLRWALAAVAAVAIVYVLFWPKGAVSGEEARRLVQNGARLVDVRTREEFVAGHLPGAVNIPLQELERRAHELGSKQEPVVVYCRSGARSARAARLLAREGYEAIADLGPMSRW